ncbi:MAG: hypothetical protein AMJ81_02335 [Phycisphaerae bacterium SM23_33]|jgi:hypothetical protein|nr:MAG: hypothetical protein AMJ81_02335 [Phycisphaerae bacterium SM23_33]
MIISPRVTSPHYSDCSSVEALLASPRFAGKTGQDLAMAIWEFMVDKTEGFYHFWPALERLTNHSVYDPLKLLNCFGWAICGVNANLLAILHKEAGFRDARCAQLKGHAVEEVFYDGAWHLFDGDLQAFHRKRRPHQDEIASYHECIADPTLISDQPSPSQPYYLPDRPAEKMAELYKVSPSTRPAFDEQAHTMDFVLRPGERLERHAFHEGKWIWFSNFTECSRRYKHEWRFDGPRERFEPHRRSGTGRWVYQPQLTADYQDFAAGVMAAEGLHPGKQGLTTTRAGKSWCVFEFDSPYVFTGTPARYGKRQPRDGCLVEARITTLGPGASARVQLAVAPEMRWFTVWSGRGAYTRRIKLDLTKHVVNSYRYLLRFHFDVPARGACVLQDLRVVSWAMVNPASLGRLVEGANPLTVRFGDSQGLLTRRHILETNFADEQDVRCKAHRLENLRFLPESEDRILPAQEGKDYVIVFKAEAPRGRLIRVYAFGSYRGEAPDDPGEDRVAAYLGPRENGPWRAIFKSPLRPDPNRWHFSAQGERLLDKRVRTVFVKFVGKAGMNNAKVRIHWLENRAGRVRTPLSVTHVWEEASGCCKSHTERVMSFNRPYSYELTCGPGPILRSLVLEADSVRR